MPPKNASKGGASQSKKADQKKKERIIEVSVKNMLIFLMNFSMIFKTGLTHLGLETSI